MIAQLKHQLRKLDRVGIHLMNDWGIPLLRVALGIVFLWFGTLKLLGLSPIEDLIATTYTFLPYPSTFYVLGILELLIGLGLVFKLFLRFTLILLWLQLLGTFGSAVFEPLLFFQNGNPLLLTLHGEFLVKNLVLFASGIVIAGHKLRPFSFQPPMAT